MTKLGLLATAAALTMVGGTAARAESMIVQEQVVDAPLAAPGQQVITERTIEPGLFGERYVRERTVVTQPMVTEQTIVAPAPRTVRRVVEPRYSEPRYVEPRYVVEQMSPPYQPGVRTVVSQPSYTYGQGWNGYGTVSTMQRCSIDFDGIRRCY